MEKYRAETPPSALFGGGYAGGDNGADPALKQRCPLYKFLNPVRFPRPGPRFSCAHIHSWYGRRARCGGRRRRSKRNFSPGALEL